MKTASPVVAVCYPAIGHLNLMVPVIESLRARDVAVHVMTSADLRPEVERAGGHFIDLFTRYPLDQADATTMPRPARAVSFAAAFAEPLSDEVAALSPSLILYDTFSVVAPVIAKRLGLPYVNVCGNHAAVPERTIAALHEDGRVAISAECWAAVERLREVHGMSDANPFSYVEALSPFLNLYPEPAEFLTEPDRAAFEPLAFFGSLAPSVRYATGGRAFPRGSDRRKVLVSFGTVIWRYYEAEALAALATISAASADLELEVVVSLGHEPLNAEALASLRRSNVQVEAFPDVDQWALLAEADLFITHHGINSTHEAVFHEVPMLSYPFFGDQPDLARRCQELGLAVPLAAEPRAVITPDDVRNAITRVDEDRSGFAARLAEARTWELRTIAGREQTVDRILELAAGAERR